MSSSTATRPSQIQALEFLFNSTQGDQWRWKNEAINGPKWTFASPQVDPCNDKNKVWQGITCSSPPNICKLQSCEIVSLVLYNYNLNGTLPFQFFVPLTSLTTLEIPFSTLIGTISSGIGYLSNLHTFSLAVNRLTGTIPSSMGSLSRLTSLYLDGNRLTGTISIGSFVQLSILSLSKNQLSGTIPTEIGSLIRIGALYLHFNQFSGTIPAQIGSLTQLGILSLSKNEVTGAMPSQIGDLSHLSALYLDSNRLTGSIPSKIGCLSSLEMLDLSNNQLTGIIHSGIGILSQLNIFSVANNQLTGTIPTEFRSLLQLASLYLSSNQFTGTIPSEICSSSQLGFFSLENNRFSGAIPPEIGSLSQLSDIYLQLNQLTGTIPAEIGSLLLLTSLYLYNNLLTGTIPSEIGSLSQLILLYLDINQLRGTIPPGFGFLLQLNSLYLSENHLTGTIPSEIGSLSLLGLLYLFGNHLSGTLPSSFSDLTGLNWLHLHENQLSGQLTLPLASLPRLERLFLHQNRFTGRLNDLISTSPWNSSSSLLLNLDVSDNLFSGSIPSTLFLPHLQSISLSLNCFEHELPSTICEAMDAEVISMDGLGSSNGCKNVLTLPFTSVSLVRSLTGSIPDCVWSMSKLKLLNLAGNGLRGKIGTTSSMLSLLSLTLSHNYLSGEIPLWLQKRNMSHLDLSHNKLTGDANGFRNQNEVTWNSDLLNPLLSSHNLSSNLSLAVNRLSGDLPNSFGKYTDLDILSGNLFSCALVPKNDQYSDSVGCGSEEYDQTLILMGVVVGSIIFLGMMNYLFFFLFYFRSGDRTHDPGQKRHQSLFHYPYSCRLVTQNPFIFTASNDPISSSPLQSTITFCSLLSRLIRSTCVLAILCLLFSLPVYVLKQLDVEPSHQGDSQYVTHSHMYNWLWTMAFVSGTTPAILLLLMCLVCLLYLTFVMNHLGGGIDHKDVSSSLLPPSTPPLKKLTVWMIFLLNVAVVGTVNGLYLWSTLLDLKGDVRIWIQVSFAFFSLLWSLVLRHRLPSNIKESKSEVWLFTSLNLMNNVIIPCLVTALSSPSCYQVSWHRLSLFTHFFSKHL
jgi:Leucine-rich repeat (LRR) protein